MLIAFKILSAFFFWKNHFHIWGLECFSGLNPSVTGSLVNPCICKQLSGKAKWMNHITWILLPTLYAGKWCVWLWYHSLETFVSTHLALKRAAPISAEFYNDKSLSSTVIFGLNLITLPLFFVYIKQCFVSVAKKHCLFT